MDSTGKQSSVADRALTLATRCAEYIKQHPNAGSWWNDPAAWRFIKEVYEPEIAALRQEIADGRHDGDDRMQRQAADEIERLRAAAEAALPWLEKAAPLLSTSRPWEALR